MAVDLVAAVTMRAFDYGPKNWAGANEAIVSAPAAAAPEDQYHHDDDVV